MTYLMLLGVGLISYSSINLFKIINNSVIIDKKSFVKIEERIRSDERERVLNEVNR